MAFGSALINFWLDGDDIQLIVRGDNQAARRINLKRSNNNALYDFLNSMIQNTSEEIEGDEEIEGKAISVHEVAKALEEHRQTSHRAVPYVHPSNPNLDGYH